MSTLSPDRLDRPAQAPTGLGRQAAADPLHAGRPPFRRDIQGLRAVAVLAVVLYHCDVAFLGGGYVGVDVFLVISGFLITSHLVAEAEATGRVRLLRFWSRRIRRLLPAALLVIGTTVVVAWLFGPALEATRTARDAVLATFYAMNYHLAGQGVDYQQAGAAPSPLQHFWSLAVEEQFYLVWPVAVLLVVLVLRRAPHAVRRTGLLVVVLAVTGWSLHESVLTTATNAPLAYFSLQTRAWELGIGAALALVAPLLARRHRAFRVVAAGAAWLGLTAIVWSAVAFDDSTPFPGLAAVVPVAGAALVIAAGVCGHSGGVETILDNRPTQLVGHVSYGWYLWHWPAIVLGPALWGFTFGTVEKLEMAVIALWLALLTYLLVERPVLLRRISLPKVFGLGLAASVVTAALAGAAIAAGPTLTGPGAAAQAAAPSDSDQLTADLKAALAVDELPSNLEPALDQADADVPQTSRDGCHLELLSTDQPPCVYGDPDADKTMVLLGDSHAEQWFSALDLYAQQRGYRLLSWTKVACPLADLSIDNDQLGRQYTECDQWRQDRLAALDDLDPDVVVAGQSDAVVGTSFDNQAWADGTARTLQELTRPSRQVVFLSDTPTLGASVPGCLAAHTTDVQACDVLRGEALLVRDDGNAPLLERRHDVEQAVATTGAAAIDVQRLTCVRDRCPVVVGSTLVYRDDSHLTQHYVRSVATVLAQDLDTRLDSTPADGAGRKDTP